LLPEVFEDSHSVTPLYLGEEGGEAASGASLGKIGIERRVEESHLPLKQFYSDNLAKGWSARNWGLRV